jgi:enediyne biosynthesis protein E4
VKTDGSYLSASDIRIHAGLGRSTAVDVSVEWPGGPTETWKGVAVDRLVTLRRGSAK